MLFFAWRFLPFHFSLFSRSLFFSFKESISAPPPERFMLYKTYKENIILWTKKWKKESTPAIWGKRIAARRLVEWGDEKKRGSRVSCEATSHPYTIQTIPTTSRKSQFHYIIRSLPAPFFSRVFSIASATHTVDHTFPGGTSRLSNDVSFSRSLHPGLWENAACSLLAFLSTSFTHIHYYTMSFHHEKSSLERRLEPIDSHAIAVAWVPMKENRTKPVWAGIQPHE